MTKTCPRCAVEYMDAESAFFRARRRPDGLAYQCKACSRETLAQWESKNREHRAASRRSRYPANRAKIVDRVKRYDAANPAAKKARDRARYARKADAIRAASRERYAATPRTDLMREEERARYRGKPRTETDRAKVRRRRAARNRAGGSHTEAHVVALYQLQAGSCFYCGSNLNGTFDVDHIMPLALGGTDWAWNLALSCGVCNRSKGSRHPLDWALWRQRRKVAVR